MASNTSDFFTYSATAGTAKNLQKPQDGGDNNQWGNFINVDLDEIVAAVNALSDKIADANEKTLVDFTATGSAVNHVGITNAATGNGPTISTAGTDSNVDLNVTPKGTGDSVFTNKIKVDDIIEKTSAHGVEIDGVTLKDGGGTFTDDISVSNSSDSVFTMTVGSTSDDAKIDFNNGSSVDGGITYDHNSSFASEKLVLRAGNNTPHVNLTGAGNVEVLTGNLVIGTAGKGIDFSAQTASSTATAQTSEILDHFEFGTWSPIDIDGSTNHTPTSSIGYYVRIGNLVMIKGNITGIANVSSANSLIIGNLPFNSGTSQQVVAGAATANYHNLGAVSGAGLVTFLQNNNNKLFFYNVNTGNGDFTALKFNNFFITGATVHFEAQYYTDY